MIRTSHVLSVLLFALSAAPACADDGFMAIYMSNQKIGSPVAEFWTIQPAPQVVAVADGFMAIHMANQKVGSPVVNFWLAELAAGYPAIDVAQIDGKK